MSKKPKDPLSTLDISPQGLGSCLKGNRLTVPKYQRVYSWDEENVANFLADINTAFANGDAEYFMGSLVLQGGNQEFEVVDGQQRLTTASIFIAALRNFLQEKGLSEVAQSLEEKFLLTKDTWTQTLNPKLTLSIYDHEFFLSAILQNKSVNPTKESHERLLTARAKVRTFFEGIASHHTNWFDRLRDLTNYLEHKAKIIQVVVPTQANAYVIFETLNDRGKDLSASDLLKNHLFGTSDDRLDEVQANWNKMLGVLEPNGGDDVVITYIRQLWSSTRELVREKELFAKIKGGIVSKELAVTFAEELATGAQHYAATLSPGHPSWDTFGAEAKSIMTSLHALKVERYRPALMAILAHMPTKEVVPSMRYILNGSVRYLIAVGAGGGTLESAWSDAARKVSNHKVTTAKDFAVEMAKIVPNDEVFRSAFRSASSSKGFLGRYYLTALERHARGEKNAELVPNPDTDAVNLEHVIPDSPSDNWPGLSAEVASALSRRLGNQALLSAKKNSQLGNQSFATKKKILAESEFILTKEIGSSAEWGAKEVDERQAKLAEMAVKTWSYKVSE